VNRLEYVCQIVGTVDNYIDIPTEYIINHKFELRLNPIAGLFIPQIMSNNFNKYIVQTNYQLPGTY